MPVSQRILNGSITKGSSSRYIGFATGSDSKYSDLRDGYSIRTIQDLSTNLMRYNIRANSDMIRTINGRDLNENIFDETTSVLDVVNSVQATNGVVINSIDSPSTLDTSGKFSERFHHRRDKNLGQTDIYDDDFPFFDHMPISPTDVVVTHPAELEKPPALVDSTGVSGMNGSIDVFGLRHRKENSGIEEPYYARGFKASFGHSESSYKRCSTIQDGINLGNLVSPEHFLDNDLSMTGKSSGASYFTFYNPGAISVDFQKIEPYKDRHSESEKFYLNSGLSGDIKNYFIHLEVSSVPTVINGELVGDEKTERHTLQLENYRTHDKMSATGFQYEDNNVGIDSIAYGGLKK